MTLLLVGRNYSARRALTGSMRSARRAGIQAAARAVTARTSAAAAKIGGFTACVSNNTPAIARAATTAPHAPIAIPTATGHADARMTSPTTCQCLAPSAMRTPISRVRWTTEYATTPYTPVTATSRAIPAISPNSSALWR